MEDEDIEVVSRPATRLSLVDKARSTADWIHKNVNIIKDLSYGKH